jgi:small subunit ribosomal protein S4
MSDYGGWIVDLRRSKVRLSRALGVALTPKAARVMERRATRPGQHGRKRSRDTDYKTRLLEKQRLRAQYNIGEGQLRRAMKRAVRRPGRTGEVLLSDLETRLDNMVLRAGFAPTIYQARQAVTHGHIRVDGKKVDKPAYRLQPGQVVEVAPRSKGKTPFIIAATGEYTAAHPTYLHVDQKALRAQLLRSPTRHEIPVICDEQLVVEYYAR